MWNITFEWEMLQVVLSKKIDLLSEKLNWWTCSHQLVPLFSHNYFTICNIFRINVIFQIYLPLKKHKFWCNRQISQMSENTNNTHLNLSQIMSMKSLACARHYLNSSHANKKFPQEKNVFMIGTVHKSDNTWVTLGIW